MKIVHEWDEDYHETLEILKVGRSSVVIAYDGRAADAGMVFEDMMKMGLLGEHAPSGVLFEQVGMDDWDYEYLPWEQRLGGECRALDFMENPKAVLKEMFAA